MKLTIVIAKGEEFFVASIKEIPAVISQGITIEDAKENVIDALKLYLEDMQEEPGDKNIVLEEDLNIVA
jgi:predicted RNase H-like HicB family nuclease